MSEDIASRVDLGQGLKVFRQGFGCMGLSDSYGPADRAESLATLNAAVEAGINLIDTANVYGQGHNEELVAELLRERRNEVTLATKFGILSPPDEQGHRSRGDAGYVRECVEGSLRRLDIDVIDLYYYHRRDLRVPLEETVGALAELITAGKIRHIGLSEVTAEELRQAHAVHPVTAVQSEWSLWSRDVERNVVPAAAELGVGFVPYAPLGRGFLTNTLPAGPFSEGDSRRKFPRFDDQSMEQNRSIARAVATAAGELGITAAQLSLAWLYRKGEQFGLSVVPIPGTRRASRVRENLGALDVQLEEGTITALEHIADDVRGARAGDPTWVSAGRE